MRLGIQGIDSTGMDSVVTSNGKRPLVLMITDFQGIIPQRIHSCDGYDLDSIKDLLEQAGAEVQIVGAHDLDIPAVADRRRVAALYASSQAPRYKQYLQDIVANLMSSGVMLFPAFANMLAHEDKAFQAIRLAMTGISTPRSFVFGSKEQAYEFLRTAKFPLVGKSADGHSSRGVDLICNDRQGRRFVDRLMVHRSLRKGRSLPKRVFQRVFKPKPVLGILLFQELIPNLEGDWKVLIWGNTACGMYRENRANDFRASGSGKLLYIDVPACILDFAWEVQNKLGLPWASLDVAHDGKQCYLLEYQVVHFGLIAADNGRFYYVRKNSGVWEKRMGRVQIEMEMAEIIASSLRDCGWLSEAAQGSSATS